MRLPTCEDGLNNLDKVYCTFAFSTPYFSCSCFVHDPTSNADLIYLMGRIVCFSCLSWQGLWMWCLTNSTKGYPYETYYL